MLPVSPISTETLAAYLPNTESMNCKNWWSSSVSWGGSLYTGAIPSNTLVFQFCDPDGSVPKTSTFCVQPREKLSITTAKRLGSLSKYFLRLFLWHFACCWVLYCVRCLNGPHTYKIWPSLQVKNGCGVWMAQSSKSWTTCALLSTKSREYSIQTFWYGLKFWFDLLMMIREDMITQVCIAVPSNHSSAAWQASHFHSKRYGVVQNYLCQSFSAEEIVVGGAASHGSVKGDWGDW